MMRPRCVDNAAGAVELRFAECPRLFKELGVIF